MSALMQPDRDGAKADRLGLTVHPQYRFDKYTDAGALVEAQFYSLVIESGMHHTGQVSVLHEGRMTDLVPAGFKVRATHSRRDAVDVIVAGAQGVHLLLERRNRTKVLVSIAAKTGVDVARWRSVLDDLGQITAAPDKIPGTFWAMGRHGPSSTRRMIAAARCADVDRNYGAATKAHLEELLRFGRQRNRGGLIVWFGPAGTGKTTAVRAMANEWAADREMNVITDIEKLLADGDYLSEVTRPGNDGFANDEADRAKLIVAEDIDPSLLAEEQTNGSGGLARLLGLTDGLMASATDAIVLLTTNARRHQIAPSLQRPGRCLALVEFGPLSVAEANRWLPPDVGRVSKPTTLAELYQRAGLIDRIGPVESEVSSVGTYL